MPRINSINKSTVRHNFKSRVNDNHSIYNSKRWKDCRRKGLEVEPFCVECIKQGKPLHNCIGSTRDHIIPINQGGDIYDMKNHQTLCARHHNIKSANESRKRGAV